MALPVRTYSLLPETRFVEAELAVYVLAFTALFRLPHDVVAFCTLEGAEHGRLRRDHLAFDVEVLLVLTSLAQVHLEASVSFQIIVSHLFVAERAVDSIAPLFVSCKLIEGPIIFAVTGLFVLTFELHYRKELCQVLGFLNMFESACAAFTERALSLVFEPLMDACLTEDRILAAGTELWRLEKAILRADDAREDILD